MTTARARCAAAHADDPTRCEGAGDAVLVRDRYTAVGGVLGCVHHGARMLASIEGGRVYPGHAPGSAAIAVWTRAQSIRPFAWVAR
ncbi:hypothetical protein FF041_02100 [Streptomyces jumonjinensis]|uniref:Uncharacterized protein n=1 Tax=Streptomyces jumonjinensis TaxID=1945 RepID=A0A646K9Z9_STRJU|nr:hypothetical protein [Streptomyces jumonjinensis]